MQTAYDTFCGTRVVVLHKPRWQTEFHELVFSIRLGKEPATIAENLGDKHNNITQTFGLYANLHRLNLGAMSWKTATGRTKSIDELRIAEAFIFRELEQSCRRISRALRDSPPTAQDQLADSMQWLLYINPADVFCARLVS
jgi:hypothetical protein